jgi:undecaprenyl-diphosphatase
MVMFGGIAEDVITGDPLVRVDALVSEWFHSHSTPRIATGMQLVSALASPVTLGILFACITGALLWKRLWYWLLAWVAVAGGGMLVNVLLKNLFDRPRPGWADPGLALTDPGFPSGHTMMATIFYGFLAVHLILECTSRPRRLAIAIVAALIVLAVALSRIYLGAHYLSDVLAAIAAGIAWVVLCIAAVETLRRYRGISSSRIYTNRIFEAGRAVAGRASRHLEQRDGN